MLPAASNVLLLSEAAALTARLKRLRPLSLEETRVAAAEVDPRALLAIERHLTRRIRALKSRLDAFAAFAAAASPADGQRVLTQLRMRFNLLLSDYNIFADVLTQRSEPTHGVWLAGFDALADDALDVPGLKRPPLVCYLERGRGAAVRRAKTRLPTGAPNPVAVVRLPRERLVGSGVASSLFHEVGHQGAALLGLVEAVRPKLAVLARAAESAAEREAWLRWSRWLSEIVADLWAVARCGLCAPAGLISVVSLPSAFVFRINDGDPHPSPWIRVLLSAALGQALYPAPHWAQLSSAWRAWYPPGEASDQAAAQLRSLAATIPELVQLLLSHPVQRFGGRTVASLLARAELQPSRLRSLGSTLPELIRLPPSLAIAAVGLHRLEGRLDADEEADLVDQLLHQWAVRRHFKRLQAIPHA